MRPLKKKEGKGNLRGGEKGILVFSRITEQDRPTERAPKRGGSWYPRGGKTPLATLENAKTDQEAEVNGMSRPYETEGSRRGGSQGKKEKKRSQFLLEVK